jgi:acyl carrier protein
MFNTIQKIIVSQMGIRNQDEITLETNLIDDLGCDSIDAAEIIIAIENEFEVEISEDAIDNIKTVGDIIEFLEENK